MTGLLSAWLVEAGIVSWRAWKRDNRPPLPSEFVAVFVVFGSLGLVAEIPNARGAASATGWGIVLATALKYWDPANPTAKPTKLNLESPTVAAQPGTKALTTALQRPVQ